MFIYAYMQEDHADVAARMSPPYTYTFMSVCMYTHIYVYAGTAIYM